jgi:predicted DNA-binding protein
MTKRKPQQNGATPETRMVNVRVPVDQLERLRLVAEADHRTVSQEVRRLIDIRITESEQEAA